MDTQTYRGELILLRGLPGSGKTTIGKIILQWPNTDSPDVLSADDFFINDEGEYIYDPLKIKEAHFECQNRCAQKMRSGSSRIVVANTFTEEWEMEPYFEIAKIHNYRVHTLIVENRHGSQNIHGVPLDKVKNMKKRFVTQL
jgi:predicted kinase